MGCELDGHGGNHDRWINKYGHKFPIPRHREINERLAKKILKKDAIFNPFPGNEE